MAIQAAARTVEIMVIIQLSSIEMARLHITGKCSKTAVGWDLTFLWVAKQVFRTC
jgi:hypothetical protein